MAQDIHTYLFSCPKHNTLWYCINLGFHIKMLFPESDDENTKVGATEVQCQELSPLCENTDYSMKYI